jgi:hypothetical protein
LLTGASYPASPGLFISTIKLKEAFMMPEWLREQVDRTYDCNDNWLGAHADKSRYGEEDRRLGYFYAEGIFAIVANCLRETMAVVTTVA